jgi:hypothetical protein
MTRIVANHGCRVEEGNELKKMRQISWPEAAGLLRTILAKGGSREGYRGEERERGFQKWKP